MRRLRPVGERIATDSRRVDVDALFPGMHQVAFFQSGTASLAAALREATRRRASEPEVILPAYGCPALVAATRFVGAAPVLIDLEPDRPWLSLEALESACSPRTAAVVAVNLLGCGERIEAIRSRIGDALLIEDSAQHLPEAGPRGDLVVLSFGRGKPLSVLGGGAVLSPSAEVSVTGEPPRRDGALGHRLKLEAYNLLTRPLAYGVLERLPGLRIGETRYASLDAIGPIRESSLLRLWPNLERHRQRSRRVEEAVAAVVSRAAGAAALVDLPRACGAAGPHLRYPILARDADHASALMSRLAGRGVSRFYERALPEVQGVADRVTVRGALPHARDFAARLLTLPTHADVTKSDLEAIASELLR